MMDAVAAGSPRGILDSKEDSVVNVNEVVNALPLY